MATFARQFADTHGEGVYRGRVSKDCGWDKLVEEPAPESFSNVASNRAVTAS
jgi:hypothetical protein